MQISDKYTYAKALEWLVPYETQSYIVFWFPVKYYGYDKLSLLKVGQMYLSFAARKVTVLDNSSEVLLKKNKWSDLLI